MRHLSLESRGASAENFHGAFFQYNNMIILVSGKCEWQHQFIIRIQDQQHWIFGERQQDLKIIN